MAEDNRGFGSSAIRDIKPGCEVGRAAVKTVFAVKVKAQVIVYIAHSGKHIDDRAKARIARERIVPLTRIIAIHVREKTLPVRA